MTRFFLTVTLFLISDLGHGYESLRYQGFFNTGVAWSSTKWPYEKDKWDITNKASFTPLTNAGLSLGARFAREFFFEGQLSTNTMGEDIGLVSDYAFLRFQPRNLYHMCAGRLRNETLFYSASEKRSITHPWTIPPAEVYGINRYDHYDGLRLTALYSYSDWDFSAGLFAGQSKVRQESGSTREYLGIMGVILEIDSSLFQGQLSYNSYRTNDPDLFWSERRTAELSISLKTSFQDMIALIEYMNHTDADGGDYIARSNASYEESNVLENQANNTSDEALRESLATQIIALREQAELEAAANDYQGFHATIGYHYQKIFGFLSYAASDGVIQEAWAYHGKQSSISVGANYAIAPHIVAKAQLTNAVIESGYKGLFDSPFEDNEILENSTGTSTLDSGSESVYSFAINTLF